MPLYTWRGVDAHEYMHQGQIYAFSLEELEDLLKKNHIGLMYAHSKKHTLLSHRQKDELFSHLASLLAAHIPLYESLCIMRNSYTGEKLLLFDALIRHIAQGTALTEVLAHANILDPFSQALLGVGESTGTLGPLCAQLVSYRAEIEVFVSKIRHALTVPLVTLGFFVIISCILLMWVVPQSSSFFEQNHMPIPQITLFFMQISSYMTLHVLLCGMLALGVILCLARMLYATKRGHKLFDLALDSTPIIGSFRRVFMQVRILKSLGILLTHHVPLVKALESCEALTGDYFYQKELAKLKKALERGESFTRAWHASSFTDPEIEGLLGVGEVSGRLGAMMLHASGNLEKTIFRRFQVIALCAHPLLLAILALLIGCLIYGIYIPLIEFSSKLI